MLKTLLCACSAPPPPPPAGAARQYVPALLVAMSMQMALSSMLRLGLAKFAQKSYKKCAQVSYSSYSPLKQLKVQASKTAAAIITKDVQKQTLIMGTN